MEVFFKLLFLIGILSIPYKAAKNTGGSVFWRYVGLLIPGYIFWVTYEALKKPKSKKKQSASSKSDELPDEVKKPAVNAWVAKRSSNSHTVQSGSWKIKGGYLPRKGLVGADFEYCYDGTYFRETGSSGRTRIYKTDGNLQIFFRRDVRPDEYEFNGLIVDIYYKGRG